MSDENTVTPESPIPDHLAENYRQLVADENRNLTFKKLAKRAEADGDKALAAWARSEAAKSGKPTTPTAATPKAGDTTTRVYDALKVDELRSLVTERSIDASDLKLKADLVAALELDDEAKAKAAGQGDADANAQGQQ